MTTLWLTLWCKSYIRSCKQVTLEAVSMQVLPSAVAALVHYAFEHKFLLQIATWKYTFISTLFTNIFQSTYNNQSPYLSALDFSNPTVWNIQLDFFQVWTGFCACKIQVWSIKLTKSKIQVKVVKNVILKETKMVFPRFFFLINSSGCSESTRLETGNVYLCKL